MSDVTMTVAEWLMLTRKESKATRLLLESRERIVCADGFNMSVQAGSALYCTPRDNDGPWVKAEVGFPSAHDDLLMPYAEDAKNPTETVYGYVPTIIIDAVIAKHGGWAKAKDANT